MNISMTQAINGVSEEYSQTGKKQIETDDFFKIISAQLKYQDPMQGGDNGEFVAQLVQFAELDGIDKLNDSLSAIVVKSDLDFVGQLLGKKIAFEYDDGLFEGVVENFTVKNGGIHLNVAGEEFLLNRINAIEVSNKNLILESDGGEDFYDI